MTEFDEDLLGYMTPEERVEFEQLLSKPEDKRPWSPLPGPQSMAYESTATIIGFGGAAGGGKSDVGIGKAITQGRRCVIFRRNGTELVAINDRIAEVLGDREAFNGKDNLWRFTRYDGGPVQLELGSFPNDGDERKYRGRPHDLIVFDEASDMREKQIRFLLGWLRTVDEGQRCQALFTFNPPTTVEGRWVISFFAPWLDKKHPRPAAPGELRWFASIDGKEREVESSEPFEHNGERIVPLSRTFIPSRITDNPYLLNTGYMAQLQSLEEPFRSMMLYGDFAASVEDDPYQVIPTPWVEAAMARWTKPAQLARMDAMGVDVAKGGRDNTVIARRHGMWFNEMIAHKGSVTPDGPTTAGLVISALRDEAVIHVDVFGVGAEAYGALMAANQQCIGVQFGEPARGTDRTGRITFKNLRSELWWRMREALDPANNTGICLPPDRQLLADLCAPTWEMTGRMLSVASRDEIIAKIGRSPDWGTAAILALMPTPKRRDFNRIGKPEHESMGNYDPYRLLDEQRGEQRFGHNPYA